MRALFHQFNTGENHIMFDFGFNLMSTVFPIIFLLFFAVFIAFAVSILVKGFTQYKRNNASPVLTVNCTVVTKRTEVSHHHHLPGGKRQPDGICCQRPGIWPAGGGRSGKFNIPGDTLPGFSANVKGLPPAAPYAVQN